MQTLRPAAARGRTQNYWLDSFHSFSFADYRDSAHVGFGPLRVINEDFVREAAGFPMHGHSDMEILTYVLSGALEHKDSLGNGGVIRPGDVQLMSAGKGILHSEFNPSEKDPVHLLQIWIRPSIRGTRPRYQQVSFDTEAFKNTLFQIVAPEGEGRGALEILQDARVFATRLDTGAKVTFTAKPDRRYWLQVAAGNVIMGDAKGRAGDGLGLENHDGKVDIEAEASSECLLFDLPGH